MVERVVGRERSRPRWFVVLVLGGWGWHRWVWGPRLDQVAARGR